uniref:Uncharacterized protein n=1 Tax=Cannabis sativa TaxID=3483 RepID=A0A803R9I2_CANSA
MKPIEYLTFLPSSLSSLFSSFSFLNTLRIFSFLPFPFSHYLPFYPPKLFVKLPNSPSLSYAFHPCPQPLNTLPSPATIPGLGKLRT